MRSNTYWVVVLINLHNSLLYFFTLSIYLSITLYYLLCIFIVVVVLLSFSSRPVMGRREKRTLPRTLIKTLSEVTGICNPSCVFFFRVKLVIFSYHSQKQTMTDTVLSIKKRLEESDESGVSEEGEIRDRGNEGRGKGKRERRERELGGRKECFPSCSPSLLPTHSPFDRMRKYCSSY